MYNSHLHNIEVITFDGIVRICDQIINANLGESTHSAAFEPTEVNSSFCSQNISEQLRIQERRMKRDVGLIREILLALERPWGHCAGLKMRCDFAQIFPDHRF